MYFPKKYFSRRNSVINTLFLTENTIPMDPVKIGMQLDEQERDLPRILEEFRRNEYEGSTAENTEDGFEDQVMQPIDWDTIANQYGVNLSDDEETNSNGRCSSSSLSSVPASSPSATNSPMQGETRSSRRKDGSENRTSSKPRQRGRPVHNKSRRKVHPLMTPERLVGILKILKAHKWTIEGLVIAYLNLNIRGHYMATLNTRRARFRKLLFNASEVYEAISKAPSTPGEIITMVSARDLRKELIGLTQIESAGEPKEVAFTKWNKKCNPGDIELSSLPSRIRDAAPKFSNLLSILCANKICHEDLIPVPHGTLVMITSMILHSCRPRSGNMFSRMLGLHLSNTGCTRRALTLLNKLGVTESYQTLLDAKKDLAEYHQEQLKGIGQRRDIIFAWDNFDWQERVRHQSVGHTHRMHSVTTARVIVARDVPKEGLSQKDFTHDGILGMDDFTEAPGIIEDDLSIAISRHLIAKSIHTLFPNSTKDFWESEDPRTHTKTLNYPMPTINLLDPQKTESYQLGPILENEGTVEGTAAAKNNIFQKQMGWGKEEEEIKGCLFVGTGDAKSSRNMKSLQSARAYEIRDVDRHQNMLPVPALFHLQMNFAYAIQKAYDGSKTNNPDATKTSKSTLLWHRSITGIKGAHGDKPEYFTLRDLLVKSFRSRIIAAVLEIEQIPYHTQQIADALQAKLRKMSREEFATLVEAIRTKFFASEARESSQPTEQEFRNHVLFLEQMETFLTLNHAIKNGDIGLIERCINKCILYFHGATNWQYASEWSYFKWLVSTSATSPILKKAIWSNMLVNLEGKRSTFYAVDLLIEHGNGALKEVLFRNRTSTFDLLDLFRREAILAGFHGSLRIAFENAFKVHITGRHPDKVYETEIFMVASELARDSIRKVESKVSYLAPDLLEDGWDKLGYGGKLDEYNSKFPSVTGMHLDREDVEGSASAENGGMIVDLDN
jgi:hypothetical protein